MDADRAALAQLTDTARLASYAAGPEEVPRARR